MKEIFNCSKTSPGSLFDMGGATSMRKCYEECLALVKRMLEEYNYAISYSVKMCLLLK